MITLSLLHPLHKTPVQSWSFDQESVIRIGRSTDNNVVLYSAVVSRHHVEIHRTEAGWAVKSIGTNGTYLDGRRITEVAVEDGLVIRLARSGPNIQIHMSEEKRDPLKELLSRRRTEDAKDHDHGTQSEPNDESALPHQITVINQ
ncbi:MULTISPECIES: FHA domain-containing protein [Cyanophyceae]|uniref:FHA domain-containing protein n=1 Tax=Cyanophyceae TaxID=3028117 RepID=UPI001689D5AB|nr:MULTISPECIES: FHA domain-containing protein [unclassified Phormidium]MBD1916386.1 FHA domain-containing protein [Phormidium sp. FACHB-77]MBD2032678.1 FHA domain-containing protein [Phormidium sp. FACHB-322]MBD2050050.1 FHA domain-containing protein [Leptolyngbya sp. FACHB-60]